MLLQKLKRIRRKTRYKRAWWKRPPAAFASLCGEELHDN